MSAFVRTMDWASLRHEYDLDAVRLMPWDALSAPFEGAWCVIRAKTTSTAHKHDEHELFIAISGQAEITIDGKPHKVSKGDLIAIPLNTEHFVSNPYNEDFHMYSVWWSVNSAAMFLQNQRETV